MTILGLLFGEFDSNIVVFIIWQLKKFEPKMIIIFTYSLICLIYLSSIGLFAFAEHNLLKFAIIYLLLFTR